MSGRDDSMEVNDADLEQKYAVPFDDSLDTILCVEGIPVVPKEKSEKLLALLAKIFGTIGRFKKDSIHMPTEANGTSKGFVFVEFEDAAETVRVFKLLDGYQLDKNHTFSVSTFGDIFEYANVPPEWTAPVKEAYKEKENLRSWLHDSSARDQFVVRASDDTAISWNTKAAPDVCYHRQNWTDTIVQWSPKGSYLATFHRQGIALWGGQSWSKIVRFSHDRVREIEFSPNERFLITWSEPSGAADNLIIWNVATGLKIGSFKSEKISYPALKWSHDDSHLARVGEDLISIYDTTDMRLKDRKNVQVNLVRDLAWSPKQKVLAYWNLDPGTDMARVTLLDVNTMTPIKKQTFLSVFDCKLMWQSEGEYLIAKVDTYTKSKKSLTTALHVLRMKQRDISAESLTFEDSVVNSLAWEPKGNMFSIIRGEGVNTQVSFYAVEDTIRLVKTFEKKQVNHMIWCPRGQFIILAGLGQPINGQIEFWNAKDMELMGTGEHFMCSDIEWDPSGRYVISSVSAWKERAEHGYWIWDFKGKILFQNPMSNFFQILWRPRPPTLLTKNKVNDIKKNLQKYSAVFTKQDEAKDTTISNAARERRRRILDDWFQFMRAVETEYGSQRGAREEIRGYASDDEQDTETIEEIVEEILEETKTQIK